MVYPIEICFPCIDCGKWTKHKLIGEHHFYLVYECVECLKRVLVHKAIVWQYVDMSKCGQPI